MKRVKTGGRQKGSQNKTTVSAKQLFLSIMEGQQTEIKPSLDAVRKKDPVKYLNVLARLFPYFMPKKLEIDTPTEITINVKRVVRHRTDLPIANKS